MSLLELVLESLADGVTVQDRDFAIIYQNKAMQRFFGRRIGEKCYEAYERRPTICEGCGLKTVMSTGQPRTVLRTAFEADGTTSFWENTCSAVLDESGQVVAFAEVCRNVSQRASLEEGFKETNILLGQLAARLEVKVTERNVELARANLYLDQIINAAADPLFVKDEQGRYELVNRAFCELIGRSPGELLGESDAGLYSEDEARTFHSSDRLVLETGSGVTIEEDVTAADGSVRTIVVKKTCFTEPGGAKRIVGITRDITERKRLEAQLRQSQKMESIGMLAGGIAHDFNNLLTPILGGADLLLADTEDAERLALLRDIRNAAERLEGLTRQLLAFGRKQVLELRKTDLRDIVRRFEPVLRRTLREDIRILTALPSAACPVLVDASQIEQVLLNLAVNARDAMPGGGKLTIGVERVQLDEEYATGHPDVRPGPHVQLSVSDTGCGMDAQTQARIFEPFFTTKAKGRGSGLGLSTVYGIIRQQGGTIDVYSEPGRGSTFKVYMQLCEGDEAAEGEAAPAAAQTEAGGEETILVLEDNDVVRDATCRMLRRLGYRVLSADGPDTCMDVVRGHAGAIDLLLTDVVLRESNGPEVYEQLRARGILPKVLYMSGYTGDVVVHHGVLEEGVQFLQKPLSYSALATKIRQVLDAG